MLQHERLADHAADRQSHVMHALDAEHVQNPGHVRGKLARRVVARYRLAAAVTAHIDPQDPEAVFQQRLHLLGPHSAIGCKRVREAHNRRLIRPRKVIGNASAVQG